MFMRICVFRLSRPDYEKYRTCPHKERMGPMVYVLSTEIPQVYPGLFSLDRKSVV